MKTWWHRPDLDGNGICVLPDGKRRGVYQVYLVSVIADRGEVVGYRFRKEDGTGYDVPKDGSACECLGWLRWGRCKHAASIRELSEGNDAG